MQPLALHRVNSSSAYGTDIFTDKFYKKWWHLRIQHALCF